MKGSTKNVNKFQRFVDKYISTRGKIKTNLTSSCKSSHKNNNMNKESFITTKTKTHHLGMQKTTNTNNNQLDGKIDQTHTHVVNCRSHKSKMEIRNEKDNYKKLNNKADRLWKIFQIQHDLDKTPNKDRHHEKEFSSNSEATNNVGNSSSHHRSINSRAYETKSNS